MIARIMAASPGTPAAPVSNVTSPVVARAGYLSLPRVLALVGGVSLLMAFWMPWFSSQGLLLSGQFLHSFLSSANPNELRQFLPTSGPGEVQLLRGLVDVFPACGVMAAGAALLGGVFATGRRVGNSVLGAAGVVPLAGWAVGITRLPPGSNPEIGLWLIAVASLAILLGLALDVYTPYRTYP
jgi:hypothetical protein